MSTQPFKGNLPVPGSGAAPESNLQQRKNPAEEEDSVPLRERRTNPKGRPEVMLMNPEKMQQMLEANVSAEFEAAQRAAGNSSLDHGLLVLLSAIAFFITGAALGWGAGRLQRAEAGPQNTAAAALPAEADSPTLTAANAARITLAKLAGAKSVEDRLSWVLEPQRVRPAMERYYREGAHNDNVLTDWKWETLPVRAEDLEKDIAVLGYKMAGGNTGKTIVLFLKRDRAGKGDRYLLDWESYLQQRENTLQSFLADPQSPPSVFRLYLERKHVFGKTEENAMGCLARCLSAGASTEIVTEASDNLYRRLNSELKWGQPISATVELEWQKSSPSAGGGPSVPQPKISKFYCLQLAGVNGTPEVTLGKILVPEPVSVQKTPAPAPGSPEPKTIR